MIKVLKNRTSRHFKEVPGSCQIAGFCFKYPRASGTPCRKVHDSRCQSKNPPMIIEILLRVRQLYQFQLYVRPTRGCFEGLMLGAYNSEKSEGFLNKYCSTGPPKFSRLLPQVLVDRIFVSPPPSHRHFLVFRSSYILPTN